MSKEALKFSLTSELKSLNDFIRNFPKEQVSLLSSIAKKGREVLRSDLLSGQALNLKSSEKDIRGRYLIQGRVGKRMSVNFSAYPVNLFERGRKLKDGSSESPKFIITGAFKNLMVTRLQGFSDQAFTRTIKTLVEKV